MLKHLTLVVFTAALFFSLSSIGLALALGKGFVLVILASALFNVWALVRNERGGIVRKKQARRAFEPARHFNAAQIGIVILLIMAQLGIGIYTLLT